MVTWKKTTTTTTMVTWKLQTRDTETTLFQCRGGGEDTRGFNLCCFFSFYALYSMCIGGVVRLGRGKSSKQKRTESGVDRPPFLILISASSPAPPPQSSVVHRVPTPGSCQWEFFLPLLSSPPQLLRQPSRSPKNRPSASAIQGILCSPNCDILGLFGRRWDGQGWK